MFLWKAGEECLYGVDSKKTTEAEAPVMQEVTVEKKNYWYHGKATAQVGMIGSGFLTEYNVPLLQNL